MEKSNFLKLQPMLLHETNKPFNNNNYLYEVKYDGIRALIYINNKEIIIKSRNGIILNDTYPELLDITNISKDTCIFDGEIVLLDNNKPNFSKLQERNRLRNKDKINLMAINAPVIFICFDILYKKQDLTNMPLLERKKILAKFKDTNYFCKTKYIENNGTELFKLIKRENLEGIVAKKKDSIYTYDIRTYEWLKIKNFQLDKFFICGYINNNDKNKYVISLILGEKINNKYYFVGKVTLAKKDNLYEKLMTSKKLKNYLENYADMNATFIKPNYNIEVNYIERTKNNYLRQPFIKK